MNGLDVGITYKVPRVERKNPFDAMHSHSGYQSCVMNLNAGDVVSDEQLPPFLMDGQTIRQQPQLALEELRATISFRGSQSVSVTIQRPSAGIPEFSNVLRGVTQHSPVLKDGINRRHYMGIIVVIRFYQRSRTLLSTR
jgi:hypothetical protein